MEQKKKALGRGLEELFSTEVLDFDTFESNIMENATTNEFKIFLLMKLDQILISPERVLMKRL